MATQINNHKINTLFWNANSLIKDIDELYSFMVKNNIHIACINETFFKEHTKGKIHQDFILHRLDRQKGHH